MGLREPWVVGRTGWVLSAAHRLGPESAHREVSVTVRGPFNGCALERWDRRAHASAHGGLGGGRGGVRRVCGRVRAGVRARRRRGRSAVREVRIGRSVMGGVMVAAARRGGSALDSMRYGRAAGGCVGREAEPVMGERDMRALW